MTGLPAPLLISVLCMRMGCSDVGGGFVAAASSNIVLGGQGVVLQRRSSFLNMAGAFLSRVAGLFLGPQVVGKKGFALEGPP